ncbi:MAG: hypothetical protein ACPIOQ_02375 [Promethearchaeia archaeon]
MGLHPRLGADKSCWIRILDESLVMMVSLLPRWQCHMVCCARRCCAWSFLRVRWCVLTVCDQVIESSTVAAPRQFLF